MRGFTLSYHTACRVGRESRASPLFVHSQSIMATVKRWFKYKHIIYCDSIVFNPFIRKACDMRFILYVHPRDR